MNIQVSADAVQWYKNELLVEDGTTIRFFVRYGGVDGLIPGFSLGVNIEEASNVHTATTIDGLTFFVAEEDAWYFEDKDLDVKLNEQLEEPQFMYL